MSDFERLGVCPEIIQAIEEDAWLLPTPVQDEAIPLILGGGDVCAAAETGSGKTGAFGIPCLQLVHETLQNKALTTTSSSHGAGNTFVPNFIFDVNSKDQTVFVSQTGLEARCDVDKWNGIKVTGDVLKGKYMFEVEIISGLVRVGWAASVGAFSLGTDDRTFGYGKTGKKSWHNKFEDYGSSFGDGDVIGCLIDRDAQTISFAKNGKSLGTAFAIPPTLHTVPLKPAVCGRIFEVRLRASIHHIQYPIDSFVPIGSISPDHTAAGLTRELDVSTRGQRKPLCLVLEPTRDLAQQTYDCMMHFGRYLESPSLRIGLFVGGVDEGAQKEALHQGLDVVVGTLAKIMFYIKRGFLDVSNLSFLVLDEADDLMKNDEKNSISWIKRQAFERRRGQRIQTLFFSATLHSTEVRRAIETITSNPTWVDLKGKPSIPDTVHCVCYQIDPTLATLRCRTPSVIPVTDGVHTEDGTKPGPESLSQRTKIVKPQVAVAIADAFGMSSCLVFCRTNVDCDNFEKYLISLGGGRAFSGKVETGKENPYSCAVLAGMKTQEERLKHLEYFKAGDVRFLICTDVAARGIDIKELPFLMMLTLPDDPDQFFHRVGRVGRADNIGLAISLVSTKREKVWYHKNCRDRGKNCSNTNLVEQGGCCIWFDEPAYLAAIEEKVGAKIPVMDPTNFSVKGIIDPPGSTQKLKTAQAEVLGRRSHAAKSPAQTFQTGNLMMYGKSKGGAFDRITEEHMSEVSSCVNELRDLERQVQQNYVAFLSKGLKA